VHVRPNQVGCRTAPAGEHRTPRESWDEPKDDGVRQHSTLRRVVDAIAGGDSTRSVSSRWAARAAHCCAEGSCSRSGTTPIVIVCSSWQRIWFTVRLNRFRRTGASCLGEDNDGDRDYWEIGHGRK